MKGYVLTEAELSDILTALDEARMLAGVVEDNMTGTNAQANAALADSVATINKARKIVLGAMR